MCKENSLFIGFDILLILTSLIWIIIFCDLNTYSVPLIIAGICGLLGGISSLIIIIKNNLNLEKYNFIYVISVICSVVYYLLDILAINYEYFGDFAINWLITLLPVIIWFIILIFMIKNIQERVVLILNSPMIYFVFLSIMFGVYVYIDFAS